jgi:mannobiose 2-epimerase
MIKKEVSKHLEKCIIPFWKNLRDDYDGGYISFVDYNLKADDKAEKGCILNSRILWFFSNAYMFLKDETLLDYAKHAFIFLKENCLDSENGGVFWSIRFNGVPADTTKYTYNQAFAIYALSSYYEASGDDEALHIAFSLFKLIEERCTDKFGYKEAFTEFFIEIENDKLSENDIIAEKTMNTLLHLLEAYTELYRVLSQEKIATQEEIVKQEKITTQEKTATQKAVASRLEWILSTFAEKIYNPALRRQEVFFDKEMSTLIDLHSYGHDIEAAWLIDRAVEVLGNRSYFIRMTPITANLSDEILKTAYNGHSLAYENEKGEINSDRIWWVQAEAVAGFLHACKREPKRTDYLEAVKSIWKFIKDYIIDSREDSEWLATVGLYGTPIPDIPIVDEWKCPYHNGRMCFEILKSAVEI